MRALFGILITGAIALTAGIVGFQAGVASNVAAAGGVVWLGGGFPGLGFLFFLMFLGVLFFAVGSRRAWARGPMGGPGHWGGHGAWGTDGDARRQWVADVHRRLHEEAAAAGPTTASTGSTAPTGPTASGSGQGAAH
jgi:hypothetical protein